MDLENYKKAWTNQPEEKNKVSAVDIYKMAHAKSSSIVKWIFIIGIIEFVVFKLSVSFIDLEKSRKLYQDMGIADVVFYSQIFAYGILFYFLYLFYMNYKKITVLESTKKLLTKIIKTRKTVRNYVIFNLAYLVFIIVTVSVSTLNASETNFNAMQTAKFIGLMFVVTIVFVGIMFLIYQLLYGILLRKLNKNYKEISKLDALN